MQSFNNQISLGQGLASTEATASQPVRGILYDGDDMNKQQILDAITRDLRGKLARSLPEDITLTEEGERELLEAIHRPYMNHPNAACAGEWTTTVAHCSQRDRVRL